MRAVTQAFELERQVPHVAIQGAQLPAKPRDIACGRKIHQVPHALACLREPGPDACAGVRGPAGRRYELG